MSITDPCRRSYPALLALALGLVAACDAGQPQPAVDAAPGNPAAAVADAAVPAAADRRVRDVDYPPNLRQTGWLQARAQAQQAQRGDFGVDVDFSFSDIGPESGLDFLHVVVDDAGRVYKAVHYDHGNGIAVADIDSDGRLDVYLSNQAGANGLYRNLGAGRFEDVTAAAGVAVADAIGVSASFADIDNDGDADLYVTNVRSPNRLFLGDGQGRFTDVSAASGTDVNEHSSGAVFFDYDNDGLLDLFVTIVGEYTTDETRPIIGTPEPLADNVTAARYHVGRGDAFAGHLHPDRTRQSRLFRNLGAARFEDVTEQVGLVDGGWSGDATFGDLDGDGWQDLYVLNMQGHDGVWLNRAGERFERLAADAFVPTPWGSMGVKRFDADADGDLDLLITDMHSDMSEDIEYAREKQRADWITTNWTETFLKSGGRSVYGNALLLSQGTGSLEFVDDSAAANVENYWPWGVTVADLNADGQQDALLTSSMNFPFRYASNTLLIADGPGRFRDAEFIVGIEPRRDDRVSTPWFRLDCAGPDSAHRLCADSTDIVRVRGALGTRSAAIFDMDSDGDLDIVTNEFGDRPQVLRSDLAERREDSLHWLQVRLVGTGGNRDGLGAEVTVVTDDRAHIQVNDGKSGYLSQSRMPLYFGLDGADRVAAVEVRWPDGRTQRVSEDLDVNTTIEIRQP